MKPLLTFLSILLLGYCQAQYTIDSALKRQYDSAYSGLPTEMRNNLEKAEASRQKLYDQLLKKEKSVIPFFQTTYAIVTSHIIDTLNLSELNKGAYRYNQEGYKIMFCNATLTSDSLFIILTPGFAQNSSIDLSHLIIGEKVQTNFREFHSYDTTFSTSLSVQKTNDLVLHCSVTKFVLSDSNFIVGKTVYGYAEVGTDSYYTDNIDFDTGLIKKRIYFKYFFKVIVTKNST